MLEEPLRANTPSVTSENFDDEVVLVNFDSGKYHSIQGTGVDIWQMLLVGSTVADIQRRLRNRFAGNAAEMDQAAAQFVDALRSEDLVVVAGPDWQSGGGGESAGTDDTSRAFVTPSLTTFTDMQELLQLDPIHEVDPSGWPVARMDDGGIKQ